MVGKKPPKDATREQVDKYRETITRAILDRDDINADEAYDSFLDYVYSRSYYSRPLRTTR